MLSIGFSTTARADETRLENIKVDINHSVLKRTSDGDVEVSTPGTTNSITIYPNDKTTQSYSMNSSYLESGKYLFRMSWTFSDRDGNLLLRGGKKTNLILENGYYNVGYGAKVGDTVTSSTYIKPTYNRVLLNYYDGTTSEYIDIPSSSKIGNPTTIHLEFTPEKDVLSIEFHLNSKLIDLTDTSKYYVRWYHLGEMISDNSFNITIDTESVEAGLLSGIIGWIKNIYDSIVNLPQTLWNLISEGLKSLFIPSEDFMQEFQSKMELLLEERLGAVYEVMHILTDSWNDIQSSSTTSVITMPSVTVPFGDSSFTFGGNEVDIVPSGFEWLADSVKILSGVLCTILFVNGMKKRYDEIMR